MIIPIDVAIKLIIAYFFISFVNKVVEARNINDVYLHYEGFLNMTSKIFNNIGSFIHFLHSLIDEKFLYYGEEDDINIDEIVSKVEEATEKKLIKYEDKYLEDIRKMPNEYAFTEEEKQLEKSKITDYFTSLNDEYLKKIEEINDKLGKNEIKLTRYEGNNDYDYCNDDDSKEEKIQKILTDNENLDNELRILYNVLEDRDGKHEIILKSIEKAREEVINQRLDKLKNNFIIEKTPLGNVLMFYNHKRESFEYYSDCTIPYRYLEPVGRKYVKTYNCRPIFIDMEEELKEYERKLEEKKKEEEKKRLEEENMKNSEDKSNMREQKKNVFTKFKSYNKDGGSGRVVTAAPPKNSIPNNAVTESKKDEPIILKEKTNRYTHEGKFSNFNILKKVDRKVVNKKYGMTFADFKKMQQEMKN